VRALGRVVRSRRSPARASVAVQGRSATHATRGTPEGDGVQTIAVRKLQRLLDALRPTRADCKWTAAEQLHLVLFAWLKDKYPLHGVIAEQKIGKAQERVHKLLKLEVVRDLLDELKVSSDSEVTRNLMDLAPKLRTPEGRGAVVREAGAGRARRQDGSISVSHRAQGESAHLAVHSTVAARLGRQHEHPVHDRILLPQLHLQVHTEARAVGARRRQHRPAAARQP